MQVGTGLNYLDASGAWQPSQDLIELTPDGGAAASRGSYKVYWSTAGLNSDAALTITTASNSVFQARMLGIFYFNPATGESKLLAAPSDDAVAELLPPNQIVYRSAFNSDLLKADLRYTYTKSAFESEVILTAQPKVSPSDCGFDPATALLQVRHQWLTPMAPRIQTLGAGPGPSDQLLDFGELWFPRGRAFTIDAGSARATNVAASVAVASAASGTSDVAVGKTWQQGAASSTLTESVNWTDIAPKLSGLPLMAKAAGPASTNLLAGSAAQGRAAGPGVPAKMAVRLAATPYRAAGLVVDYLVPAGGSLQDYTFQTYGPGPVYVVRNNLYGSPVYASGTLTFQPGCVIRFLHDSADGYAPAYILTYGGVVCNGTTASPSVFTSYYDFQYGDPGTPPYGMGPSSDGPGVALWLYYIPTNVTVSGVCVRYGVTAIEFNASNSTLTETVSNAALYSCQTGIQDGYGSVCPNVSIVNSACYQVATPTTCPCGGNPFTGAFSQGAPPALPTLSTCDAVQLGNDVTLYSAYAPPTVVDWYLYNQGQPGQGTILVGTGQNVTLTGTQVLTTYGLCDVYAGVSNPFGSNYAQVALLQVTTLYQVNVLNYFLGATNSKVTCLWSNMPFANPPNGMAWNFNSLIYGPEGFTAISQLNSWDVKDPLPVGQVPVTALTRRHGYTRGHGMGFAQGTYGETNTPMTVWFCAANNQLVPVTATNYYTRYYGDYDYTVLIFTNDLPPSITPMDVGYYPQVPTVLLRTCQATTGSQPGSVAAFGPSTECAVSQFNDFNSCYVGDSGSPNMVLTSDNFLVFVGGTTTTGPCDQMQADMDFLSQQMGLNPSSYKMTWHATQ